MPTAFVALGSNLHNPLVQIKQAINRFNNHPAWTHVRSSRLYLSPPLGPQDQAEFVNAVVQLNTELAPLALLDELQKIEQLHHRTRERHWGPRTLDCDLLLYDQITLNTQRLILPHPGLTTRSFVLYPLADIAANCLLPDGHTVSYYLNACPFDKLHVLCTDTGQTLWRAYSSTVD